MRGAVAPPEQVTYCVTELVDGVQGFACSTAADGAFWRVYRLPEGASPAESFDEIEPDLLHDATLVEMRWIAPRPTTSIVTETSVTARPASRVAVVVSASTKRAAISASLISCARSIV